MGVFIFQEEGIGEFFKPSDFCGENQMYCEQCDDKVDATMVSIKKFMIVLWFIKYNYSSILTCIGNRQTPWGDCYCDFVLYE